MIMLGWLSRLMPLSMSIGTYVPIYIHIYIHIYGKRCYLALPSLHLQDLLFSYGENVSRVAA